VAEDQAAAPVERDDAIFSSTSPGVEPPAPLTPLPSGTTVIPGEEANGPFVEVLVDRNGQVEDVKLRGEPGAALARYQAALAVRAGTTQWQPGPLCPAGRVAAVSNATPAGA
jgi:hypothetical protein